MISPYEIFFLIYKYFYLKIQKNFYFPSICTGSLLIGGAGKTPLTIKIVEYLINKNKKVAVILRGYKRKIKKDMIIKGNNYSPYEIGDEAYLYLKRFGEKIIIGISKKREKIMEEIKKKFDVDIFVLDDAYQYLNYRFSKNILVLPYKVIFKKEKFFPFGKLREDYNGIKRADILIINEKFDYLNEKERRSLKKILKKFEVKNVYFMRYCLKGFKNYYGKIFNEKEIKNKKNLVFCGIGDAKSFFDFLHKKNINIKEKIKFRDHHFYSEKEIKEIFSKNYDYFITTEKDIIKIKEPPESLLYPEIDVEIDSDFYNLI
ncbi:MAG: tetraacyldisaccharide 4'-kinase [candidate division WOR-3 bacterium]